MARIRTIKPEFPHSESMGRISRDARLTFILLWTISDDVGRLRGNSRILASLLYPYDEDAKKHIGKWLAELEKEKCIQRYTVENNTYIQVLNWRSHQKIDKPSPSKLPEFVELSRSLATDSRSLVGGSGSGSGSGPGPVKDLTRALERERPEDRSVLKNGSDKTLIGIPNGKDKALASIRAKIGKAKHA